MLSPALRYFLEVVRCGSIRLAAERLHVAPSAISRQIVLLEREVGAPLLVRTQRGVLPTEQGRLVALYGNRVGRGADRLRMSLDDLGQVRRGRVSIATVEGMLDQVLPNALLSFRAAHPGVVVSVQVAGTHQVAEAVLREDVEIGIALEAPRRSELLLRQRWAQPLHAVVHPEHALAGRSRVSLGEVLTYPHVLPDRTFGIRMLTERAAAETGSSAAPLVETNSLDLCRSCARSGAALTILPPMATARDVAAGHLLSIPLTDPMVRSATIDVFTAQSRPTSKAADALLVHIRRALDEQLQVGLGVF
jgi:DNA-binding transcriptional LysR family regulator